MAVLLEVTLELVGPGEDVPVDADAGISRREADHGAKTVAAGGIDGMLSALNSLLEPQGYELRRKDADE